MGYIGSHTTEELLQCGYEVVIADNLSNSKAFVLDRIESITKQYPQFYFVDLCDVKAFFDSVIHFAASKAATESVKLPLKYFKNNLISLLNLLQCMAQTGCRNIIFTSSATVYGVPAELPAKESTVFKKAFSAYESTKQMGEDILEKLAVTGIVKGISLQYFNPVGAHASELIGELPSGTPNNLMPFLTQTAIGKLLQLTVYGNDYDTPDGSCLRDYIHIVDLAKDHVKSCERLFTKQTDAIYEVFNIGTGIPLSVLEVIKTFEYENELKLNYVIGPKRAGDAADIYADVSKANTILRWEVEKNIADMVKDPWQCEKKLYASKYFQGEIN